MNNQNKTKKKNVNSNKKKQTQSTKAKQPVKPKINKPVGRRGFTNENKPRRQPGEGTRENIMIDAALIPAAAEGAPLSVVTMGYTRGWLTRPSPSMYWAYYAALLDFKAILKNEQIPIVNRPRYLNRILEAYKPKSVPFKTGEMVYKFDNVDAIVFSPSYDVRGYDFYMYEKSNTTQGGGWFTQVPPPNPTSDEATYAPLAQLFSILASNDRPGTVYTSSANVDPHYLKDVSPFCSSSTYFGGGNCQAAGCYTSVENEVKLLSPIMANLVAYDDNNGRVGRKFKIGSCDSTATYGFGYLPTFEIENYDTTYPPIFKFIDMDEVNLYLQNWMVGCISVAIATLNDRESSPFVRNALTQIDFSAQQWRIALRQCILSMFADSQAISQFMTYHNVRNNFEAFRVGSNTYPGQLASKLIIPSVLNENLRCLLMTKYKIPSRFQAAKNKLFIIPVWGVYKSADLVNEFGQFIDPQSGATISGPLFTRSSADDPDVIDGVDVNDNVCDLNASNYVKDIIAQWNSRINLLQTVCGTTGPMGGTSEGSLLNITRVASYANDDKKRDIESFNKYDREMLNKNFLKTETIGVGKTAKQVTYYVPPNASLYAQTTRKYTSICTITETMKQSLQYYILPSIVIDEDANSAPTVREYRVGNLETNIVEFETGRFAFDSRGLELYNAAVRNAPGTAAAFSDELAGVVQSRNENGLGGFLGDMLGAFGPMLPF